MVAEREFTVVPGVVERVVTPSRVVADRETSPSLNEALRLTSLFTFPLRVVALRLSTDLAVEKSDRLPEDLVLVALRVSAR